MLTTGRWMASFSLEPFEPARLKQIDPEASLA